MESLVSGKIVYGGVLQFTSPAPDSAYLPQWMLEHLGAAEGEEVAFNHVDLPKGKFVQLQPVSSSWLVSFDHVNNSYYSYQENKLLLTN